MLLAYIDEIGETGAFVERSHSRYNTSPAFGYAGFVIPADQTREFGAVFQSEKRSLYAPEIRRAVHPGRWEKKGSDIFRPTTPKRFPAQLRVFSSLVRRVRSLDGWLFYHAEEKPLGTPKQTELNPTTRETSAMRQAVNRLARHADTVDRNLLVLIDQINEKTRVERLPTMYAHILGRANEYPEMRRIVEPPMHIDSTLCAGIQFADWIAACVGRAIDYQLLCDSPYDWLWKEPVAAVRGSFTRESKLHLWNRSVSDLHHSDLFKRERPLYPQAAGHLLGDTLAAEQMRRVKAAAERARDQH